jgi:hypothetical protein
MAAIIKMKLVTSTVLSMLLYAVASANIQPGPRQLRHDQDEILDLAHYRETIRTQYYNQTISDIEGTPLRKAMRALIDFKNSIPRHDLTDFDIMSTNFAPEDSSYLQGIIYSQLILLWCVALLIVIFFIFVIGRYACGKCDAQQVTREEIGPNLYGEKFSFLCLGGLLGLFLAGTVAVTLFGNIGYLQQSNAAQDSLDAQSKNLTDDIAMVKVNAKAFNDLFFTEDYRKKFGQKPQFDIDQISTVLLKKGQDIRTSSADYLKQVSTFEGALFITITVVCGLLLLVQLLQWISLPKTSLCLSSTSATCSLFLMIAISAVFTAVCFRLVYTLDFCEQVFQITD